MDTYTIYIINKYISTETFWCFLSKPEQLKVGKEIYANSSARLTLKPDSLSTIAKFEIPVQYKLAATSLNKATGLGIRVSTQNSSNVSLGQEWAATFYTGTENQAPDLDKTGSAPNETEVVYKSNAFDPQMAKKNRWFPNKTFGMETVTGFIGMTWEASPSKKDTISPNVTFYINTGSFHPNTLADYSAVQDAPAALGKDNFDGFDATVILNRNGRFDVQSGAPSILMLDELYADVPGVSGKDIDLAAIPAY